MNKLNEEAIQESLVLGRTLTNDTFIKDKKHKSKLPKINKIENANTQMVIDCFEKAMSKKANKANTIALSLSGGKDSRVILALANNLKLDFECITYSFKEDSHEVAIAKKLCKKINVKHKYVKISPEMYFIKKNEKTLLKLCNGNPNYFPLMLWKAMENDFEYDVVFSGNLMTEFMDTGEYRWYEGNDIRLAFLNKEKYLDIVDREKYVEVKRRITDIFYSMNAEEATIERKRVRFLQLEIMKNFINWDYPVLDQNVINAIFSLKQKERMGSRLTRNMLKKISPELYNMPVARSPLSLKYPLWIHQGYAKISKGKTSKGLEHMIPPLFEKNANLNYLTNMDLDFIDKKKIRQVATDNKDAVSVRLINIKKWMELQ